jgi:hypothetical protein
MSLLSWQTLVFLIPLGVGCLLALGAAFGLGAGDDGEAGGDGGGHHGGHDGAHHPDTWLGLGHLPLTIRLMLLSLTFGGIGLCLSYLLAGGVGRSTLGGLGTVAVALVGAWWVSGRLARLVARRLPLLETETVRRQDLLGSTGRAVLAIGPTGGLAQVHDRRGNLHQVRCHTLPDEAPLPAGADVLLVDYDEEARLYRATASPVGAPR